MFLENKNKQIPYVRRGVSYLENLTSFQGMIKTLFWPVKVVSKLGSHSHKEEQLWDSCLNLHKWCEILLLIAIHSKEWSAKIMHCAVELKLNMMLGDIMT